MLEYCANCFHPVIVYNPNCIRHTSKQPRVKSRKIVIRTHFDNLSAAPHIKMILQRCFDLSPHIVAEGVLSVTRVDIRSQFNATIKEEYEAGELFACIGYFSLELSQVEIGTHAQHSQGWARLRLVSGSAKFSDVFFVEKLRAIALHLDRRI